MLRPDLRRDPADEILRAQQVVEVSGYGREFDWVIRHRYASVHVAQKIVLNVGKTGVVGETPAFEATDLKERAEQVFKRSDAALEILKGLLSTGLDLPLPLEEKAFYALLALLGWQVRQCKEIFAFEMHAFGHELFPTLFVDERRHEVRKCAGFRVTGGFGPDSVTLNHPAAPKSENRIQTSAQGSQLGVGCRRHVGTTERPSRQESSVLE
jgi:hypothetical protein